MSSPDPTHTFPPDATRTGGVDGDGPTRTAPPADATATGPHTPADPAAPTVPGYEVLELLGEGGMGVVWKARQVRLNRPAALKMVHGGRAVGAKELIRFLAEAEAVAAVRHPHVVQVYEFGDAAGRPYLAMEYLPGGSLADRLKRDGRLAPAVAAELVGKVARAVQAAHDQQIVHRDLKPANVLFDEKGEPKVTDFGLAKRGAGSDLTGTQAVLGTPAYMAPEQAKGETKFAGPAADVWALGVVLYECLTGRRPFDADDALALLRKVAEDDPVPPRRVVPAVPRDLELIGLKCLSKEPAERYATAAALADDLGRFASGEPVSVRAAGVVERGAKWVRRKPTVAAAYAVTAVAVVLAGLTAGAVWLWQRAERDRSAAVAARDGEQSAREQADQARGEAEAAREKLAAVEYARTIQVAHQYWRDDNVGAARVLLAGTRADLRGWEYDYVHRLCHADLVTLKGHTRGVLSAVFSSDGQRVVTAGGDDGTARVWDVQTGQELLALKGHTGRVNSASFSPDGRRVVTGGTDRTARVWDAESGRELLALKGHTGRVNSASFSPDGRRVVTAGDITARVWDAQTGQELLAIKGHTRPVLSAEFSPDGRRALTSDMDGTARVWDAESGRELLALKGHVLWVRSASFSPDGRRVVTAGGDGPARVWDVQTGQELLAIKGHTHSIMSASFSPDGRRLVTASGGGTARVWDAESGRELLALKGHVLWVRSASFSPDGRRVVTAGDDGTARVWDAQTGRESLAFKGIASNLLPAAFSPDGRRLLTLSEDDTVRVWDAESGRELLALEGHASGIPSQAFSPDGRQVVMVESPNDTVRVWDAESGRKLLALNGYAGWFSLAAFSPDGRRVVTARVDDGTTQVWDAQTGQELVAHKHAVRIESVSFSPDGRRVVTKDEDNIARVRDAEAGQELLALRHADYVNTAAFSRDGRRLVTAGSDGARVWDSAPVNREFRPKELAPLPRPTR